MKNRQLKFRIWNDTYKEMFYPKGPTKNKEYEEKLYLQLDGVLMGDFKHTGLVDCSKDYIIQQWTGEYDKNNTPLYEGDIVKCERPEIWLQEDFNERAAGIIMYFNAAFHVTEKYTGQPIKGSSSLMDYRSLTDPYLLVCEVIGNIHENEK